MRIFLNLFIEEIYNSIYVKRAYVWECKCIYCKTENIMVSFRYLRFWSERRRFVSCIVRFGFRLFLGARRDGRFQTYQPGP